MSRFEKRVTDEQIATARQRIAEGATLRAAAAEIPCAPSTLSYRIKKAGQAEGVSAGGDDDASPDAALSARGEERSGANRVGPLEILRLALQATKANGQPDWSTRISAARALAALRPQELEPTAPKEIPSEIIVFDLEPGAHPVMHRPSIEAEASAAEEEAESNGAEASGEHEHLPNPCFFSYQPSGAEGADTLIGGWVPPRPDQPVDPSAVTSITFVRTDDPATADLWRAELSAGRLPVNRDEQ